MEGAEDGFAFDVRDWLVGVFYICGLVGKVD